MSRLVRARNYTSFIYYYIFWHAWKYYYETLGSRKNYVSEIFVHVIIGRLRSYITADGYLLFGRISSLKQRYKLRRVIL